MTQERYEVNITATDNTGPATASAAAGMDRVGAAAGRLGAGVTAAGDKVRDTNEKIGAGSESSTRAMDRQTRGILAAIVRQTAAMESGGANTSAYFRRLAVERGADVAKIEAAAARLAAVEARVAARSAGIVSQFKGLSAGQARNAMALVPAQITDVVTQLAGGQNPLLIAIQQGGQLRDSFGGFGNMIRGLTSLLTPFRLGVGGAAAAAYLLTKSFLDGDEAGRRLQNTITLSGNRAGVTAGQLQALVDRIGQQTHAYGESADAINAMVASGKISGEVMGDLGRAIVEYARASGQEVGKLVDEFAKVADDPVKAVVELSGKYKGLNGELYDHVKALVDAGKQGEAVILVQQRMAQSAEELGKRVNENKGYITQFSERMGLIYDKVMAGLGSIGAMKTAEQQIAALDAQIADRRRTVPESQRGDPRLVADLEAKKRGFQEQIMLAKRAAEIEAETARREQEQVKARSEFDAIRLRNLSDAEQLERRIAEIRKLGLAGGYSQLEIDRQIAIEREKAYRKPPAAKTSDFVANLWSDAQRVASDSGLRADFILGQAALESGWGKRAIKRTDGTDSYNLFGIKAGKGWSGDTADVMTTEFINGREQKMVQRFRAYASYEESMRDFAKLMGTRRYAAVKDQTTPEGYGQALQAAGYATDPKYALKIADVVRKVQKQAPGGESAVFAQENAGAKVVRQYAENLALARERYAELNDVMRTGAGLSDGTRFRVEAMQRLAATVEKLTPAQRTTIEATIAQQAADIDATAALQQRIEATDEMRQRQQSLADQYAAIQLKIADYGKTPQQLDQQAIDRIRRQADNAANLLQFAGPGDERFSAETMQVIQMYNAIANAQQMIRDRVQADTLDWSKGADSAVRTYMERASDLAGQTEALVGKAFQGMEDSLVNFVSTGKLNFSDLAQSIIADLIRIQVKQALVSVLGGGSGSGPILGDVFGDLLGVHFATGGYTGHGGKYEPAGVVHRGEYVLTQEATSRIGVRALDRLNRGYANGGLVGSAAMAAVAAPLAPSVTIHQNINIGEGVNRAEVMAAVRQAGIETQRAIADQIKRGSAAFG